MLPHSQAAKQVATETWALQLPCEDFNQRDSLFFRESPYPFEGILSKAGSTKPCVAVHYYGVSTKRILNAQKHTLRDTFNRSSESAFEAF